MASSSHPTNRRPVKLSLGVVDLASFCCATVLLCFILLGTIRDASSATTVDDFDLEVPNNSMLKGSQILGRPCDEIYVVGEGETLHTISDKCGDPFIVEQNPHIHDPDDVFPGLVIKINPSKPRKLIR